MRRLSKTLVAVLATVLTSTVAQSQTPPVTPPRPNRAGPPAATNRTTQPPRATRADPVGPQSRQGFGGPASNLLRMREQLALTDEQVKKLEALQMAPRPRANEADMLRARADLMDATKGEVNLEKARAAFDRMARVRTDAQIAQLKVRQDLRNVLSAEQRTKLDAFSANMRDRRAPAMRGGVGQRIGKMRGGQLRGPKFRGQRQGQGRGQFGPGMRNGRGPNGPPDGMGQGMGPGMGMQNRLNRPNSPPMPPMQPQRVRPPNPPADTIR